MGKIIYSALVSLDGFIEAPHGDLSWTGPDEELHRYFNEQEKAVDIELNGRRMYENMAAFWPTADENPAAPDYVVEFSRIWKSKPKLVFSRTLKQVKWNSRLVRGNVAKIVDKLKEQPDQVMAIGGAELASSFMRLGLIDEYQLYFHPVLLGGGKPLFRALPRRIQLRLAESRIFGSGVVLLRYLLAGQ